MNWTTTFTIVVLTLSYLAIGGYRAQMLYDYGRKLRITPNECQSTSTRFANLNGVCMFNLECQEQLGTVIGACVDRFLFGACCHIPENLRKPTNTSTESTSLSEESTTTTYFTKISSSSSKAPSSTEKNVIDIISEISSTVASESQGTKQRLPSIISTISSRLPTAATTTSDKNNANVVISGTLNFVDSPPPTSTSTLESNPSPSKGYPTRFPTRGAADTVGFGGGHPPPWRVPSHNVKYETVGPLNPSSSVVPDRERTTLPSTRDIVTLLPITLETFSSVSGPLADSSHGSYHPLRPSHGQSHDSVEHETLTLASLDNIRNRHKPRPSSTRLQTRPMGSSSSNSLSDNSKLDSTEEPPKISTFMYVDENSNNNNSGNKNNAQDSLRLKNKLSMYTTSTQETPIEEKTVPIQNEDLNGNTENIWSVVMQLGSQSGSSVPPGGNNDLPSGDSEMSKVEDFSIASLAADQSLSSSDSFFGNTMPTVGGLSLDNTFLKLKTETTTNSMKDKQKPANTGDDQNNDSTTEQDSGIDSDNENNHDNLFKTTVKPWASSTYYVHTFTYPNSTTESDEDDSDSNTAPVQSTTLPSIGKITTWSGIGSVVDKEHLINKNSDFSEEEEDDESYDKPSGTLLTTLLTRSTPSTTTASTTTTTTTTTTTEKPSTTSTTQRVVTKRPSTRYTTRRTSTTTTPTTTTTKPTSTKKTTTVKWKKPQAYTLPAHKKPTTTEPTTPRTEPTTRRTTTTTTTTTTKKPKIITKAPVKKTPSMPSIIMDEDLDTNLDDFVEQVVQGIAGTLDNLNLEDVILPPNAGPMSDNSIDPTVDPLQVISDPLFPPFPVIGEVALTKPNVKTNLQDLKKKLTTTTTTTTTQKPLDWRKDCGVRTQQKSGRIVGGTASKFGRWPWQALVKEATWLGLFSKNKCGGVLIAPKYVLTAAHCQPGFLATLTVVLGDFDISSNAENQANSVTKNVRRVIVHRDYNAQTFENDIALLELDSAVEFQTHIVPICLPTDDEEFIGRKAYVTGWGRLKYGGGVPQILHEVDVPILKNDECQDMFHKSGHLKAIRDSFICAGYAEGFKDSCEGDSGGPLSIQRSTGQWVLAGTVSHGIKCAYPNLPGVYMRMTFYKPWIKRVTQLK